MWAEKREKMQFSFLRLRSYRWRSRILSRNATDPIEGVMIRGREGKGREGEGEGVLIITPWMGSWAFLDNIGNFKVGNEILCVFRKWCYRFHWATTQVTPDNPHGTASGTKCLWPCVDLTKISILLFRFRKILPNATMSYRWSPLKVFLDELRLFVWPGIALRAVGRFTFKPVF